MSNYLLSPSDVYDDVDADDDQYDGIHDAKSPESSPSHSPSLPLSSSSSSSSSSSHPRPHSRSPPPPPSSSSSSPSFTSRLRTRLFGNSYASISHHNENTFGVELGDVMDERKGGGSYVAVGYNEEKKDKDSPNREKLSRHSYDNNDDNHSSLPLSSYPTRPPYPPGLRPGPPLVSSPSSLTSSSPTPLSLFSTPLPYLHSLLLSFLYYITHSYMEMKKRKFNYCLGSFSCFLVVVVAAVCNTIIARAPVVFLQQAEADNGQIDMRMTPSAAFPSNFFNYTQYSLNVQNGGDDLSAHSPRIHLMATAYDNTICMNTIKNMGLDIHAIHWKYGMIDDTLPPSDKNNQFISSLKGNSSYCNPLIGAQCINTLCPHMMSNTWISDISLNLIDTQREKSMGVGRLWPYDPLPFGHVVVTEWLSYTRGYKIGDEILITISPYNLLISLIEEGGKSIILNGNNPYGNDENTTALLNTFLHTYSDYGSNTIPLTLIIDDIIPNTYGKFATAEGDMIIMEYSTLFSLLMDNYHEADGSKLGHNRVYHPYLKMTDIHTMIALLPYPYSMYYNTLSYSSNTLTYSLSTLLDMSLSSMNHQKVYQYSNIIIHNLNGDRITPYMDTNYDIIQSTLVSFSSTVLYYGGFPAFDVTLPILSMLSDLKLFSLYLGLILSIILTILFILSVMLIYSLLMISIETRQFELGVHRMCGMTTNGIIKLLLVQATSFSVPSWVVGLISSQVIALIVLGKMEKDVEIPIDTHLTSNSIRVATLLGLLIPIIASILPIRAALSKNLNDTLDLAHSKTKGVEFSIERSEDSSLKWAWIALGSGMVIIGFIIYYLLPLSLLSLNLALFFDVFFGILLGMLFGLILLSLNFQHSLERILTHLFFFWDKYPIRLIVIKNLVAHRIRNRKTSIMYALSLGFIIFITVAYQMEINTAKFRSERSHGANFALESASGYFYDMQSIPSYEEILNTHVAVEDYSWISLRMAHSDGWSDSQISNLGLVFTNDEAIVGISPNLYEVTKNEYLLPSMEKDTKVSLSEQLFTVEGMQSMIMSTSSGPQFGLPSLSADDSTFLLSLQQRDPPRLRRLKFRPAAFLDLSPKMSESRFPSGRTWDHMVSRTMYREIGEGLKVIDIPQTTCVIKTKTSSTDADKDDLYNQLGVIASRYEGQSVYDDRAFSSTLSRSDAIMTLIFDVATYIAMGLCLFSLMASMYTNIYEQSKEISILRGMGITKWEIVRLYTYEAFILVMAASLLGTIIGGTMSWTMTAQRVLFTQLPVTMVFPYFILILVILGSVFCALIASFVPAKQLMEKSIAQIMRTVL